MPIAAASLGWQDAEGLRGGTGRERREDGLGRSALVASPDGVGWPEEPAGVALGAAPDESRLTAAGLGWPGSAAGGRDTAGSGQGANRAGPAGQGQVFRDGEPEGPPVRVRQALS